jgi:hypothetical protein
MRAISVVIYSPCTTAALPRSLIANLRRVFLRPLVRWSAVHESTGALCTLARHLVVAFANLRRDAQKEPARLPIPPHGFSGDAPREELDSGLRRNDEQRRSGARLLGVGAEDTRLDRFGAGGGNRTHTLLPDALDRAGQNFFEHATSSGTRSSKALFAALKPLDQADIPLGCARELVHRLLIVCARIGFGCAVDAVELDDRDALG